MVEVGVEQVPIGVVSPPIEERTEWVCMGGSSPMLLGTD